MKTNKDTILSILLYIEEHLMEDTLTLETISKYSGYSMYHIHRLFSSLTEMSLHAYIQRRRLTEAARRLVFSTESILDIALSSGYRTQRSFTRAFQSLYEHSPKSYRKQKVFMPKQLPYDIEKRQTIHHDLTLHTHCMKMKEMYLIGYEADTRHGFHVIGKCWHKLHKSKHLITQTCNAQFLVGVNDYRDADFTAPQPSFHYFAGAEVSSFSSIPKGMSTCTLPNTNYVVFTFRGKNEDSMQPIVEYIYKEWFPSSTCIFHESACYDLVQYGEEVDKFGESEIRYLVPIV